MSQTSNRSPERRRFARRSCLIEAKMLLGNASLGSCVIRDVSPCGARLAISHGNWEPTCFKLVLNENNEVLPVTRVWSANGFMGVRFEHGDS